MNGRRLYEELGGVNERYLQQAATYRAKRKSPIWRALLIAAALVVAGALLVGTVAMSFGIAVIGGLILGLQNQPPAQDAPQQPAYTVSAMEQVFLQRQETLRPLSEDAIELFEGGAQLIWTDGTSGEYYRIYLKQQELNSMLYLMQTHQVEIDEHSERPSYQVWIAFGDGVVISPYLKANPGNTGHGELFDYDPELELSEDLIRKIIQCIET